MAPEDSLPLRFRAVRLEPRIDQRDLRVDRGVALALLARDELHQLVGALDIRRAVLQGARRRCRARETLRRRGVFLERHEIFGLRAELDAEIEDEIVYRARLIGIGIDRL